MSRSTKKFLALSLILVLLVSGLAIPAAAAPTAAPPAPVTFTILHTNDFHGQLEAHRGSSSNPGMAQRRHGRQRCPHRCRRRQRPAG